MGTPHHPRLTSGSPRGCWLLGLLALVIGGCVTSVPHVPTQNILMFNNDGRPVDPTGNVACQTRSPGGAGLCHPPETPPGPVTHTTLLRYPELSDRDFRQSYLSDLFACMHEYFETADPPRALCKQHPPLAPRPARAPDPKRVLIFVHGGLNTQLQTIERVVEPAPDRTLYNAIAAAGYYPLFINWHSSFTSSYLEQLLWVRQGEKQRALGLATAPAALGVDLARSIARAPLVWAAQTANDARTIPGLSAFLEARDPTTVAKQLICAYEYPTDQACPDTFAFKNPPLCVIVNVRPRGGNRDFPRTTLGTGTFPISVGEDERDCLDMNISLASYGLTFPSRLLLEAAVDALGTSAWENMLRRTRLLYNTDDEFAPRPAPPSDGQASASSPIRLADIPRSGGISVFLRDLHDVVTADAWDGRPWEITLVGHSMGTIIINQMLREALQLKLHLEIKNIVFMAAAASVRDVQDSVLPYLRHDPQTRFYNLMLHPVAEQRESYELLGLPLDPGPRGSLLVMIDNFLAKPLTYLDRTAGRYENFLAAAHEVPPDLRSRVHIKVFSAGEGRAIRAASPQLHGDFSSRFGFWIEDCWLPEPAMERTGTKPTDCLRHP